MPRHIRAVVYIVLCACGLALGIATHGAHAQMLVVSPGDSTGTDPAHPSAYPAPVVVFPDFGGGGAAMKPRRPGCFPHRTD